MSAIRVLAARYSQLNEPFATTSQAERRVDQLAQLVGREAERVVSECGLQGDCQHVICSTIVSQLATQSDPHHQAFMDRVKSETAHSSGMLVKAYECAGWGYVLRFLSRFGTHRHALITIVDVDIHGLCYWRHHPMWEKSGFGILTLVVELPADITGLLEVDAVSKTNALIGFGRRLAKFTGSRESKTVFSPFFPEAQWAAFERASGGLQLAGNMHRQYGHCFGSDPWVSLIRGAQSGLIACGNGAIVASLSLSGYYAFAEVELTESAIMEIDTLKL